MFLQASVILSTGGGGGLPQCMLGNHHPPGTTSPRADTHPPGTRHTPLGPDPPPEQTPPLPPPEQTPPPRADTPSPREADASMRSMSGRYASYWNAFLYMVLFCWLNHQANITYSPLHFRLTGCGHSMNL